jgi:methyl-accepting chemotaxis protein
MFIISNIVTTVVQETSRGAQESAVAAGEFSELALEVKSLVGQFRFAA